MKKTVDEIFKYFYKETGIIFIEKKDIIADRVIRFANLNGYKNLKQYVKDLKKDKNLFQKLVNRLSVNETYFFREQKAFEILKDLYNKNRKQKILSLPSSSGEESYSVCMTLKEMGVKHFHITGCDIDSNVVATAKRGVYQRKSLRKVEKHIEEKYFSHVGGEYFIDESLKKYINFEIGNIFSKDFFQEESFDYIFCRNLFIYFDQKSRLKAEKILFSLLKKGGVLFMGHADYPENRVGFEKIFAHGIYFYRKKEEE